MIDAFNEEMSRYLNGLADRKQQQAAESLRQAAAIVQFGDDPTLLIDQSKTLLVEYKTDKQQIEDLIAEVTTFTTHLKARLTELEIEPKDGEVTYSLETDKEKLERLRPLRKTLGHPERFSLTPEQETPEFFAILMDAGHSQLGSRAYNALFRSDIKNLPSFIMLDDENIFSVSHHLSGFRNLGIKSYIFVLESMLAFGIVPLPESNHSGLEA